MVPCPWFEHGAALLRDANVDLGAHLTLTAEWDFYKWRPLTSAPGLRNSEGYCHESIAALMGRATPAEMDKSQKDENVRWGPLVRKIGFTAES